MPLKVTGITALAIILVTSLGFSRHTTSPQSNCGVIEEALQETSKLKPGITGAKVEVTVSFSTVGFSLKGRRVTRSESVHQSKWMWNSQSMEQASTRGLLRLTEW